MRRRLIKALIGSVLAAAVLVTAGIVAAWTVPLPERIKKPSSRVVEYDDGTPMCVFLSPDDKWRIRVGLSEVDPQFVEALLAYEDERFYYHPGVDPVAIVRAVYTNMTAGEIVSGASTITMQLVKILEPRPRTYFAKAVEALRAVQLELRFDKKEILELYLAYVPYGKNLEGVEAASLAFFGHRAGELSAFETAYLLGVPQDPNYRYPAPENTVRMEKVISRIAARLQENGVLDGEQAARVRSRSVPARMKEFPRDNLHTAYFLAERIDGKRIKSTINKNVQETVQNVLDSYRSRMNSMGIHNAAIVVMENKNNTVAAAAGNFDFWDHEHEGQVPGFDAPRSPGSAMKPFVYAMAIDRGLALPSFLVADVPVSYSGYEPVNYGHRYRGLVALEDALAKSLNIPFVDLLAKLGLDEYLEFLREGGLTTLSDEPGYYGLSIAIGSLEVKPIELASLYAMLSRNGTHMDVAWTADQEREKPAPLLAPGACFLTRQALRRRNRPDFPGKRMSTTLLPRVFWKTGTSAFHKDAWAVGGNMEYTAAVWVGNFDGSPSRYLVGSERAGPVLFDVLEGLQGPSAEETYEKQPGDLIRVKVCSFSGHIATRHCPHSRSALAPKDSLPFKKCPFHKKYMVDKQTGFRTNALCAAGRPVESRVFTVLPASVKRWISDTRLQAPVLPPVDPLCRQTDTGGGPRIITPGDDAVFFMVPGLAPDKQEIVMKAEAGPGVEHLYWFVDGRFFQKASSHERVWMKPSPGNHRIRVMDPAGKDDSISVMIMASGRRKSRF
ncbi:MAG: penicillin-binding protein 1C [bacterium]